MYVTGVRVHLFRRNLRSSSANLLGILTNNFLVACTRLYKHKLFVVFDGQKTDGAMEGVMDGPMD